MKIATTERGAIKEILERKEAELARVLRNRDSIAIEKSADQMDEIQYGKRLVNRRRAWSGICGLGGLFKLGRGKSWASSCGEAIH